MMVAIKGIATNFIAIRQQNQTDQSSLTAFEYNCQLESPTVATMKTALAVFECLLLINWLQQFGWATPATMLRNSLEDTSEVSFDVRRDANYRTTLFGKYICRVMKGSDTVRAKLQVSFCQ